MNDYQNNYPNYQYQQQPPYFQNNEPVSVGEWILTYIVLSIPLIGLIMMFVWGFGKNTKRSKANFCKAILLLSAICCVLAFVCFGIAFVTQIVLLS